jgi:hypothetical protein
MTTPKNTPKKKKSDRITGQMLIDLMMQNQLSQMEMCKLFGISVSRLGNVDGAPQEPIQDPVTCYLYRQYMEHPELIGRDIIDIKKFYEDIGGADAVSGSDFSLIMGRELSAYVRWFSGSKPSTSVRVLIQNAMKLNGNGSIEAFEAIKKLCHTEGRARGIDVLSGHGHGRGWGAVTDKD